MITIPFTDPVFYIFGSLRAWENYEQAAAELTAVRDLCDDGYTSEGLKPLEMLSSNGDSASLDRSTNKAFNACSFDHVPLHLPNLVAGQSVR